MARLNDLVEQVLRENTQARNSDKALIAYVLNAMGFQMTAAQIEVFKSVSFESVTRARRKFNEEGKYLADDAIVRERRFKAMRVQQVIPSVDATKVIPLITENGGH